MTKQILYTTPMIQAWMDGRKKRISRPVRPQPPMGFDFNSLQRSQVSKYPKWCGGTTKSCAVFSNGYLMLDRVCPIEVGDILYARETFREFSGMYYGWQGGAYIPLDDCVGYNYKADDSHLFTKGANPFIAAFKDMKDEINYGKWRPSIHMPKEAARIFQRVTIVTVQHIDDVTEQDAIDDGFMSTLQEVINGGIIGFSGLSALEQFKDFWHRTFPADKWMFVYGLEPAEKPEGWPT